jgi:hypothetical protein
MYNESTVPLLQIDLDKEIMALNHCYGLFKTQADELEKDLEKLENRKINENEISSL